MNLWNYYDGDLKYPDLNNHSREIEIAKATPKWAYDYVERNGKNKDLEPIIAKDAKYSYWYAKFVLKGPFPLGEPAIATDEYYSEQYTNKVLKKDFILDGKLIYKYEG